MARPDIVFGIHAVEALLESQPERVLSLFMVQERQDRRLQGLTTLARQHGVGIQPISKAALERQIPQGQHQGVMAHVQPMPQLDETDLAALVEERNAVKLLVLDQVTDPHNLGACIRTAAAMGFDAVIAPRDRAAGLTPVAVKVAAGGAEKIPFVQVTNLARTLTSLKEQGVFVVGTVLNETARPLAEIDLTGNIALVMGAEDTGLRRLTQESCDQLAYIPMSGSLQSLNVSVAAGMAIYEVMRQQAGA